MQSQRTTSDLSGLYDEDFFEWTRRNAELLRAGQLRAEPISSTSPKRSKELGKRISRNCTAAPGR
jgi:hypothetical protein